MKRLIQIFSVFVMFTLVSCSKGGGSTPTPNPPTPPVTPEATIAFSIDIDKGSSDIYAVLGTSQPMVVNVSSTLPKDGITITTTVRKDLDNTEVYSGSISSTSASNTITISNMVPGVLCTTTVVVTSKTTPSNTLTRSFKIASK